MDPNTTKIEYYGKEVLFYLPNGDDHIQNIIRSTGTFYEAGMLMDVLKIVPTGRTAIDVGANIGNHTLFFSKICGLKTYSFEPASSIRAILEKNIQLNELDEQVEIFPFALGSSEKDANLVIPNNANMGMAHIVKGSDEGEKVKVKTLDSFMFKGVALIKIDAEGMELDVIKGATETIKNNQPVICAELQTVEEYNEVRSFLEGEGYIPVERYNATPTIMFWPKNKVVDYLPFFLSKGNL